MGRKSRDKGARGEREFWNMLRDRRINARRTYSAQAAGPGVPDFVTQNQRGCITWEVKRTKSVKWGEWLKQLKAQRSENDGCNTLLAFRLDNEEWMYCGFVDDLQKVTKVLAVYDVEG